MPELPEVEIVAKQLNKILTNKKIIQVEIFDKGVVDEKIALNCPFLVENVYRRGKSIVMKLNDGKFILTHLRMTGHFHHVSRGNETHKKFMKAKFNLDDNSFLTHNSIRKFGGMKLLNREELNITFSKLGVEPFEIKRKEFCEALQKYPQSNIKTKIMNQAFLVGVGNIYAQEALFHAGINPERKVREVRKEKINNLHHELLRILKLAIKNNGSTVDNYSSLTGKGSFQNFLAVYGRDNCPLGHKLKNVKLGGRGTNYCSTCQR
jgi:formamidopyrimidine-DNA glycosylase